MQTRYGQVRRKLENSILGGGGAGSSSPATKATPSKTAGVKKTTGRVGARKTPKKTAASKAMDDYADDDAPPPETPVRMLKEETSVKMEDYMGVPPMGNVDVDWAHELNNDDGQFTSLFG